MKLLTLILLVAGSAAAQDRMADTLRKGVVEEESQKNLGAAIQQYEAVLAQFNEGRETAATALFRMAECYRKQGNSAQAIAAYQRVVREFGDQTKLAEQSRAVLRGTYHVGAGAAEPVISEEDRQEVLKQREARARYRHTIEQEMELVKEQMRKVDQAVKDRLAPEGAVDNYKERLIQLERELAAFDAGMASPRGR
jgi:tetratricopeptide (TPR) repeat protein